jgi:hypothetical protein
MKADQDLLFYSLAKGSPPALLAAGQWQSLSMKLGKAAPIFQHLGARNARSERFVCEEG